MDIPLLNVMSPVHVLVHRETRTLFGVHKTLNASPPRSMSYVLAFPNLKQASMVMACMHSYRQYTGAWPNRLLDIDMAYLYELHRDDKEADQAPELEVISTIMGILQSELHSRNIGLELVHDIKLRPEYGVQIAMASPRTDYGYYKSFAEHTYGLEEDHVYDTKNISDTGYNA